MKKLNYIILATTLLGLAACANGGDTLKSNWSDAEKALLQTYAYGEEIPFIYIEGNEEMYYDADYNCLTVTGGTATAQQLSDYAVVLDSYGYEGSYVDEYLYYNYICEITSEDEPQSINLQFYCLDSENKVATSGTFVLDIYALVSYDSGENVAFPSASIATFVSQDLGLTDIIVPSLSADLGSIFSYVAYVNDTENGTLFALSCEDSGTPGTNSLEDTYKGLLEAASWVNTNDDEYTYDDYGYFYADPSSQIEIQFYTYLGYFEFYLYAI